MDSWRIKRYNCLQLVTELNMNKNDIRYIHKSSVAAALVAVAALFASCAHEDLNEGRTLKVIPYMEASGVSVVTRGYYGTYQQASYPKGTKLNIFFHADKDLSGSFEYNGDGANPLWTSNAFVEPDKDYTVMGYLPNMTGSVDCEAKTVTLEGVNPVSDVDVSVVVGVGDTIYNDNTKDLTTSPMPARPGQLYPYHTPSTGSSCKLYLLMDHLYAKTEVKADLSTLLLYHLLRDVYIKKITFASATSSSVKMVVKLQYDKDNPIAYVENPIANVATTSTTGVGEDVVIYDCTKASNSTEKTKGLKLETTPTTIGVGYVCPEDNKFIMKVVYDVYDKKGNLTRGNQKATNTIKLNNGADLERGMQYGIKFTVLPTYLYQLSDGDLDNPTLQF